MRAHRPPASRSVVAASLLVAVGVVPATAAAETITYGPILGRGQTPDRMIVRWGTQGASDPTTLRYRRKGDGTFLAVTGGAARDHEVIVKGLSLGTQYEYQVESGTAMSPVYTFATCPVAGMPMDVVFYGDSRSGPATHGRVIEQLKKKAPEMVFESGDIAPSGKYSEYLSEFFPVAKDLVARTPFMAAPGNHDAGSSLTSNYGVMFPTPRADGQPWQPYYSFVCGNTQFVSLNSNDVLDEDQQKWLGERLAAAAADPQLRHVVVWFHHSAYSPGSHGDYSYVINKWVPLFRDPRNKVTAVFSGHDHIYARMDDGSPVAYIVSGGAGAGLYSDTKASVAKKVVSRSAYNFVALHIAGPTLSGVAYDDSGTELDRFSVTQPEPPPVEVDASAVTDLATPEAPDLGMPVAPPEPMPESMGCAVATGRSTDRAGALGFLGLGLGLLGLSSLRSRRRAAAAS